MKLQPSYRYSKCHSSQQQWLSYLKSELDWQQEKLRMFGKQVPVPRKVAFVADEGLGYRYSGKDHWGQGWPTPLLELKQEAEKQARQRFNCVLLNWYQNGNDYMGWHADNEAILGPAPQVAMLSLGASRDFVFRLKNNPKIKHSLVLEGGSWLIMGASTQVLWQHTLPVRKGVQQERISLTFRLLLPSES